MSYTAQDLKKLRDATGAGFLECKDALDKAEGNYEKARQLITGDTELQRKLETETVARKKMDYLDNQVPSKIATVEQEIAMLKREILEIKKAYNSLVVALEETAAIERSASKNARAQRLTYGTFFMGDFSG